MPADPWARGATKPSLRLEPLEPGRLRTYDEVPWPGAADLAAGKPLPRQGRIVMGAAMGTVLYDVDAPRRVYVLYGIGENTFSDAPDGGAGNPALTAVRTNAR